MRLSALSLALLVTSSLFAQTDNVVIPVAGAARVILPVTGNAAGANGTFFRSDITVANLRSTAQKVHFYWRPQGMSGPATPVQTITLSARSGVASENFLEDFIGVGGLGSLEVVGVTTDTEQFDAAALLNVTVRIWTPRPDGAAGTMSQTFVAVAAGTQAPSNIRIVPGLRRSAQYRVNVGMTNPSSTTQLFRVQVSISGTGGTSNETFDVEVPARAMQQVLVPGTSAGLVQILVEDLGGGAGDWHAWGSSVDNQSGDAWSQIGFSAQ
jgi:hypothetical protein